MYFSRGDVRIREDPNGLFSLRHTSPPYCCRSLSSMGINRRSFGNPFLENKINCLEDGIFHESPLHRPVQ